MAERHRHFWHVRSWLVEEGHCDSVYDLSLWLMTSSAAAGWQWAVGWLPWQHASNRVAKANGPGMRMKAFSLAARPPPTTPQHLPHPNPLLHLSAREDQCNRQEAKVMETLHKYPWNSQWERTLTCLAVNGTWCMKACRDSPPLVVNLKLPFLELMTDLPMPHKSQFYLDLKIPENLTSTQDAQTLLEALSCYDSQSYKKSFAVCTKIITIWITAGCWLICQILLVNIHCFWRCDILHYFSLCAR